MLRFLLVWFSCSGGRQHYVRVTCELNCPLIGLHTPQCRPSSLRHTNRVEAYHRVNTFKWPYPSVNISKVEALCVPLRHYSGVNIVTMSCLYSLRLQGTSFHGSVVMIGLTDWSIVTVTPPVVRIQRLMLFLCLRGVFNTL